MLRDVRQRLGDDVVRADLDTVLQPIRQPDREVHRHRRASGEGLDRGLEAPLEAERIVPLSCRPDLGNDRFGAEVVEPLVVMELERRRDEVKATGESAWCSYPRPAMISDGLILLFR